MPFIESQIDRPELHNFNPQKSPMQIEIPQYVRVCGLLDVRSTLISIHRRGYETKGCTPGPFEQTR